MAAVVMSAVLSLAAISLGFALVGFWLIRLWVLRVADRVATNIARQVEMSLSKTDGATDALSDRVRGFSEARGIPLVRAREAFFRKTGALVQWMDSAIQVPILGGVGVGAALALIPVVGAGLCTLESLVVVIDAVQFGLPRPLVSQMLANVLTQLVLGVVPVVGALGVATFRANTRNLRLLEYRPAEVRAVGGPVLVSSGVGRR